MQNVDCLWSQTIWDDDSAVPFQNDAITNIKLISETEICFDTIWALA